MNKTYEQLMDRAANNIDRSGGDVNMDYAAVLMQRAMTDALMAIAQELHEMNSMAAQKFQDGPVQRGAGTDESGY